MLRTDRLVYVQLQKTASTRIAEILHDVVGGEYLHPKHGPVDERAEGRYVLGSVRDPWAYYLSLWTFGCKDGGGLYERLTGRPRDDRRPHEISTLRNDLPPREQRSWWGRRRAAWWADAYADRDDPRRFRRWVRGLLDPARAHELGEGFAGSSMSAHAGLYSYRYCVLHVADCRLGAPHWQATHSNALLAWVDRAILLDGTVRVEHMADDLVRVLGEAGYDLGPERVAAIEEAAGTRANPTGGGDKVASFYDRRTRDLVTERDRLIVERHGYEPPAL